MDELILLAMHELFLNGTQEIVWDTNCLISPYTTKNLIFFERGLVPLKGKKKEKSSIHKKIPGHYPQTWRVEVEGYNTDVNWNWLKWLDLFEVIQISELLSPDHKFRIASDFIYVSSTQDS